MSINWRRWILDHLQTYGPLTTLLPADRMVSGGSVESPFVDKPFLVIALTDEIPTVGDAEKFIATVWVHDEPGDYGLIGDVLKQVRRALPYQVTETGGIACSWIGNSGDLANDQYRTITRNAQFDLLGRDI